jgi:hypothetical protein
LEGGLLQKGMLVKSNLALQTFCSEQNETPSSIAVASSSASLPFAVANLGMVEEVGYESINGQIYSTCWTPAQLGAARYDDGSEEDVVSTFLPYPTIYPNPVLGTSSTLVLHSEGNENMQVTIFDMHGRIKLSRSITTQPGENRIELDLGLMDAGIYTMALQGKEQVNRFIKFVKQ